MDLTICDARVGDEIRISRPDGSDLHVTVTGLHRYVAGDHEWFELVGQSQLERVGIEWEEDDGLTITLVHQGNERTLDDLGLTEDDLMRLDEGQHSENAVELNGIVYIFEESHETGYAPDGGEPDEGFYLWSFEDEDGRGSLAVEKWEDEPFRVFVGEYVNPECVRVLRPSC